LENALREELHIVGKQEVNRLYVLNTQQSNLYHHNPTPLTHLSNAVEYAAEGSCVEEAHRGPEYRVEKRRVQVTAGRHTTEEQRDHPNEQQKH
jgi:hypothetical protein